MSVKLRPEDRINRARADLTSGIPVLIINGETSALALAAETLTEDRLAEVRSFTSDVSLAITDRRAQTLKARAYDGSLARLDVPPEADAAWIAGLADPSLDLAAPLRGPHLSRRGGGADLAQAAILLCKSARLLPAAVLSAPPEGETADLTRLTVEEIRHQVTAPLLMQEVVSARLPMTVSDVGRVHVFRAGSSGDEHYAVEVGRPDRAGPVLVRLHSACFTGDLLGSLKCDCGPQLRGALAAMGGEGAGILLYLNQEGRGIGLANKMRAYSLQDQGFDTVEANHRLGFEDDERDFRTGAAMLQGMGVTQVRLMTNNPAKVEMLAGCGLVVTERVPLKVGETPENRAYLATKAAKSGHLL